MTIDSATPLPIEIDALKALIAAGRATQAGLVAERDTVTAERDRLVTENDKLRHMPRQLRRAHFGRGSEQLSPDPAQLAFEDLAVATAKTEAQEEKKTPEVKQARTTTRRANRGALPAHLPRVEVIVEPEDKSCPCCGEALHVIGEDTSERLDKVPAVLRVIVTRRPKLACRACTDGVVQSPAPARLIEGGLPTEALVADVVVAKYADHCPLYRQSRIMARQGVVIDRSTLAHWVGTAAAELEPLYKHLLDLLKVSPKLFADETRCPVLDPGRWPRPRPATSGPSPATTARGAAPRHRPSSALMRPAAGLSTRSSCWRASPASCRSTAQLTPATEPGPPTSS